MLSPETVLLEDPPDTFSCPVCLSNPLQEAVGFQCGHTVCIHCSNMLKQCPLCRAEIEIRFPNFKVRSIVDTFQCRCDNYFDESSYDICRPAEHRCPFVSTLGQREAHLANCPFTYEYCSYCDSVLLRRDFDTHRETCVRRKPLPQINLKMPVNLHVYTISSAKNKMLMYKVNCPADIPFAGLVDTLTNVKSKFAEARFYYKDEYVADKLSTLRELGMVKVDASPTKIVALFGDEEYSAELAALSLGERNARRRQQPIFDPDEEEI